MADLLSWTDTHRASSLLFLVVLLAVDVTLAAWAVRTLRRPPRPHCIRSVAADEPSGPIVPAADLIKATWTPVVDRRHPEPWGIPWAYSTRHHTALRPRSRVAVCDRTAVDEVHRVTEEVAG